MRMVLLGGGCDDGFNVALDRRCLGIKACMADKLWATGTGFAGWCQVVSLEIDEANKAQLKLRHFFLQRVTRFVRRFPLRL